LKSMSTREEFAHQEKQNRHTNTFNVAGEHSHPVRFQIVRPTGSQGFHPTQNKRADFVKCTRFRVVGTETVFDRECELRNFHGSAPIAIFVHQNVREGSERRGRVRSQTILFRPADASTMYRGLFFEPKQNEAALIMKAIASHFFGSLIIAMSSTSLSTGR
jgi:hypothetical protein